MAPHNLYTLLTERLLLNATHLTLATYNVLFEVISYGPNKIFMFRTFDFSYSLLNLVYFYMTLKL